MNDGANPVPATINISHGQLYANPTLSVLFAVAWKRWPGVPF